MAFNNKEHLSLLGPRPPQVRLIEYQLTNMSPFMNEASSGDEANRSTATKVPLVASPAAPGLFGWPSTNERGYQINEQPMGTKRPMKIMVLGAGASGINFLKTAKDALEQVELVCYEKNGDIGGTWLENT